uniref:Uncharacterized protein n=1 Tax=Romanomermis culicivorax TaxID=13658 RepID=A0A915HL56_ROMCU
MSIVNSLKENKNNKQRKKEESFKLLKCMQSFKQLLVSILFLNTYFRTWNTSKILTNKEKREIADLFWTCFSPEGKTFYRRIAKACNHLHREVDEMDYEMDSDFKTVSTNSCLNMLNSASRSFNGAAIKSINLMETTQKL